MMLLKTTSLQLTGTMLCILTLSSYTTFLVFMQTKIDNLLKQLSIYTYKFDLLANRNNITPPQVASPLICETIFRSPYPGKLAPKAHNDRTLYLLVSIRIFFLLMVPVHQGTAWS